MGRLAGNYPSLTMGHASSIFTGGVGQGESNIRRRILENDWLEAIVALPLNMWRFFGDKRWQGGAPPRKNLGETHNLPGVGRRCA